MVKKNKHIGTCKLCKEHGELTFEHIPPKTAFNKNTRYYSILHDEFTKIKDIFSYKPKGAVYQGGMGEYCLCEKCNNYLGQNYVRSYQKWVGLGAYLLQLNSNEDFDGIDFVIKDMNPLRILKQIIAMFVCINEIYVMDSYPELLEFIKQPQSNELPDKYRIYTFLNNEGQFRSIPWSFTNDVGILCEFVFPPYGYVLNIENSLTLPKLTEITGFKNASDNNSHIIYSSLYKHPTYYSLMPLDYRKREEFE